MVQGKLSPEGYISNLKQIRSMLGCRVVFSPYTALLCLGGSGQDTKQLCKYDKIRISRHLHRPNHNTFTKADYFYMMSTCSKAGIQRFSTNSCTM